ncbi:MAG: DHHA1 domain-containing protein [Candidatus Hydrothermarchaeales archaeon]
MISSSKIWGELEEASEILRGYIEKGAVFKVLTHNDADGLAAGAIMHKCLLREGCGVQTRCLKQLEGDIVKEISGEEVDLFIFTDLGSGQLESIEEHLLDKVLVFVLDHHQPKDMKHGNLVHINPHNFGIDGAREVSGAGVAYLFSKALNPKNTDLAPLAIVGAVGDMQDPEGRLTGLNVGIGEDGVKAGVLDIGKDLRLWGRQTRPLFKAIEYTTDPFIPGLSGNESACIQFLNDLDIPVKREDGEMTRLVDLSQEERQRLSTALILKMVEHGVPTKSAESIVGDVYTLNGEEERTILRDAKEYATLLNACGRYEKYGIGIAICLGERGSLYEAGLNLLIDHKKYLSSCYGWISQNLEAIEDRGALYTFHVHNEIDENVIGTVTTMVINSRMLNPIKPVIAFVETKDGDIKVSSRGTGDLIKSGLNLGDVMLYAAEKTGGEGGGHDIAAGAQIELSKEEKFLKYAGEKIREQLHDR